VAGGEAELLLQGPVRPPGAVGSLLIQHYPRLRDHQAHCGGRAVQTPDPLVKNAQSPAKLKPTQNCIYATY